MRLLCDMIIELNYRKQLSLWWKASMNVFILLAGSTAGSWGVMGLIQARHETDIVVLTDALPVLFFGMSAGFVSGWLLSFVWMNVSGKNRWKVSPINALDEQFSGLLTIVVVENLIRLLFQGFSEPSAVIHALNYFDNIRQCAISVLILLASFSAALPRTHHLLEKEKRFGLTR
jgi:hypothetical protein